MNDQEIVALLKAGERSTAFHKLYKAYPTVEKLIRSKGGSKEDAQDIFQNALFIFYQKLNQSDFKLTAAISTYLYSVCRYLWKDELLKRKQKQHIDFSPSFEEGEESELLLLLEKEAKLKRVEAVLQQIGAKCLQLLQAFYYAKKSMKQIAADLGLKSEKVAKNQKYKCLERAKGKLKEIQNQTAV